MIIIITERTDSSIDEVIHWINRQKCKSIKMAPELNVTFSHHLGDSWFTIKTDFIEEMQISIREVQNPIKLTLVFRSKLTQYFLGVKLHNDSLLLSFSAA